MNKPKVFPPTYFLIALLAIPILHFLLPLMKIIPAPWNWFGILFILLGITIELAADRLFHQAGTTVTPYEESQTLVTCGVFRISRNPMYLGFALILAGAAVSVWDTDSVPGGARLYDLDRAALHPGGRNDARADIWSGIPGI